MQLQRSGEVTLAWFLSSLHTTLRAFDFGSGGPQACFSHVCTNMFDRRCADMFGHVCLFGSGGPLACFSHVFTNMFDRRCADMFAHVCLFGSGGQLARFVMFKQTC